MRNGTAGPAPLTRAGESHGNGHSPATRETAHVSKGPRNTQEAPCSGVGLGPNSGQGGEGALGSSVTARHSRSVSSPNAEALESLCLQSDTG